MNSAPLRFLSTIRILVFLPALWLVIGLGDRAAAQQGRFGVGFDQNMSRFIPPPRMLNQQLKDAQEAINDRRYSDAVVILGDLLERNVDPTDDSSIAGQDFFLEIKDSDQQRLDQSFLRHCRDLIGGLPSDAFATYELRYGALAKQSLEQATRDRDWKRLREVRRKYFHTAAGYQASLILAQRELYLGHPLASSLLLDDVVSSRHAVDQLGQGLLAMHAIACRLGGRSVPRELASTRVEVTIGDSADAETITDWRGWIDEHYQLPDMDSISRSADYPLLGGSASRNETDAGQLPLSTPRWMLETTATPLEEQRLRKKADELAASGRLVPPSWTPIRVGNQLLMRTTERLRGVDYRTGKRVWQYPWFQTDVSAETEQYDAMLGTGASGPPDRLSRRVWNDLPYGQITSDGKRVFLLDDLSPFQMLQINPLMGVRNTSTADGGRNTLVALELETEGKTLWRLGQNPTIESELNQAFFLGAPIAVDGALYAMAEIAGDILLVSLDPATGKLVWKQQLVAIEGAGIQFDAIRRISGATPSYHEGVLICPTGAGATVAVDLADRTLRWANSYQRRAMGSIMFNSRSGQSSDQLLQRWHNSAATASGMSVLVTPPATDNLYCFELVDGKKRFSKSRQAAFYLAGVRDDQFLMVSARDVVSHDLESGRLNWRTDQRLVSAGQQIVGRGVFGDDSYIVPTSGNELVEISLVDGTLVDRVTAQFPLGNLIAIDGEIISQGPTRLVVALGKKTLGPRVERILQDDPDNLDALVQKALLLSERGDRREALEVLQKARTIDPDSDDVLMLSISSMLGELRENPTPPPGLEEELDALIDTPNQRLEFLALRIESALRKRSVADATKRLLDFSRVMADLSPVGNEDDAILRDPARDCALDSWVCARAAEVMRIATEANEVNVVQEELQNYLESTRLESTKRLSAMTGQLGPLGIDDLVVTLGKRRIAEGELLLAERLLLGASLPSQLLDQQQLDFTADRAITLAEVYNEGSLYQDATAVSEALLKSDPAAENKDATIELQTRAEESLAATESSIDVASPVSLTWKSQSLPGAGRSTFLQAVVDPTLYGGQSFQGWKVVNRGGSVMFQNPDGNVMQLPMDEFRAARVQDRKAKISGGLMILERPGRISAVDLFALQGSRRSDASLWARDFGADGASNTQRKIETTVFGDSNFSYPTNAGAANQISEFRVGPVLGDRVLVLQAGDLLAVDTTNSETLWRNSSAPTLGHILVDQDRVAVVSYMKGIVSSVSQFDLFDGRAIESAEWEHGKVWATSGKHVLAYQVDAKSSAATVRLVDPFAGKVVLEIDAMIKQPLTQVAGRGCGRILQDRYMVLFDTNGRLVIWDLLKATELCRHDTGEMPELQSMYAMWMDGQILVLPANAVVRQKGDMLTQHGETHRTVHQIIAVSTRSGEIIWNRDFQDDAWGITVDQPYGSPVVLLARSKTIYEVNKSTPKMDVAMLRLTDGETIHEQLERVVSPQSTGLTTYLTVQPELSRVQATIDGEQLVYAFGETSAPIRQPAE
ncbi:Outer membrane protein assembly factor BamB [Stieleria maiorica]|uniref:Outer membrane protein assembly factor BamB n=1 Tax=Stieleria maiorica TaxID=2795974 RepID=A0A5B9MAR0_9BACT|nr:PQQ-binding-like beta-propeller repeat protein [Stieleria maiorica]QEF97316.1 Outer membrane protein assembly factor BamB [Stieleria maiorica]